MLLHVRQDVPNGKPWASEVPPLLMTLFE